MVEMRVSYGCHTKLGQSHTFGIKFIRRLSDSIVDLQLLELIRQVIFYNYVSLCFNGLGCFLSLSLSTDVKAIV